MLRIAFKEWAAVCLALASGRQSIIIRKGGIAEAGDAFAPEHDRFWLYPTYVHQQQTGLRPEVADLLRHAEAERPPAGTVRLTHFAEIAGVYHVHQLFGVLLLEDLHVWSEQTIRARFAYRTPGLFVLPVRVYRAAQPVELPETPEYSGCRSWVDLGRELPTDGATPVIDDKTFANLRQTLSLRLNPTALA
jgi:hypothetical protein